MAIPFSVSSAKSVATLISLGIGFGTVMPAIAASSYPQGSQQVNEIEAHPTSVAQLFYPPGDKQQVIAVTGQGRATVPADKAQVRLNVTNRDPAANYQQPAATDSQSAAPPPLTGESLQPLVNAFQQMGIGAEAIQVIVNPLPNVRNRFTPFGTGVITVELSQPNQDQVNQLVGMAQETLQKAEDDSNIFLRNVDVTYAVNSCESVETAAYASALVDAKLRATAIAKSMGVVLTNPPAVAELPFLGRFYAPCSTEPDIVDALFGRYPTTYDPEAPAEVEVFRELAVTYQIQ